MLARSGRRSQVGTMKPTEDADLGKEHSVTDSPMREHVAIREVVDGERACIENLGYFNG